MSEAIRKKYWLPLIADTHQEGAWTVLRNGYSEAHRAYHSWGHIGDMLKKLETLSSLATRPDLIAIAIFWHDAVYKTQNMDKSYRPDIENVRESANLFRAYTRLSQSDANAVYAMIMATGSHREAQANPSFYPGFENDLHFFLDLDLSSLGASWKTFIRNTEKIRTEFAWVPEVDFCEKRALILSGFMCEGGRLFRREETNRQWGNQAHANLTKAIKVLNRRARLARKAQQP